MADYMLRQEESFTLIHTGGEARYTLQTAAEVTGVGGEELRRYCELGLLGPPDDEGGWCFDEEGLYEIRRIEHLRHRFGLDLNALPLVCGLVQELDRLRAELRFLRDA